MSNANEFLSTFNKMEHFFKGLVEGESYTSFSSMIHMLKKSNTAIDHYGRKLREYNDLRNAIVHERIDGRIIAEPNEYAVKDFKFIYEKLTTPKKVTDICNHEVYSLSLKSKLSEALKVMGEKDFSQIPIYDDNRFVVMLNSDTICKWMYKVLSNDLIYISDTTVEDVVSHASEFRITLFRSKDTNVYDLIELFRDNIEKPKQIDAIIITHNGKKEDRPLAIITDYDIPALLENY